MPKTAQHDVDFTVIGGGSAGYAAARTAHELGLKVAVVDAADTLGGLCILKGCMPSKTLIETGNRARAIREAEEFGLQLDGTVHPVPVKIRDRKRRLINEFAGYRQGQLQDGRFALVRGKATYKKVGFLEVALTGGGFAEIKTQSSLIATGSSISQPPVPGLDEVDHWISDDVLDSDQIPESIIVLGGGAIAMELAHYYEGVGCEVSVIQRSRHILKSSDIDVAKVVETASRQRGIRLYTDTQLTRVEEIDGGHKSVVFQHEGGEKRISAEQLLVATGRVPNTEGLGLEELKMDFSGKSIKAGKGMDTSVAGIYAAGDVCGPYEVVHTAIEQGEVAANNAAVRLGKLPKSKKQRMDYRLRLFGVFTEPEVAQCGITEADAEKANRKVLVATYPFDDHGKSMVQNALHGFVKLIGDPKTGEILGGAVVGPHATELIHEIVVAMHFKATARQLMTIPHYHPTLSEIWTYPAEDIADEAAN